MLAAYANVVLSGHPNLILGGVFELWPGGEELTEKRSQWSETHIHYNF